MPPPLAERREGTSPGGPPPEPHFGLLPRGVTPTPMTGREAMLASLLIHALLIIAVLLLPWDIFQPGRKDPGLLAFAASRDDERIPMAFIQDADRPDEPNPEARLGSDRDRRRGQEEQPEDPAMTGPFSRGNTPAMIAEGPLGPVTPPAPPAAQEPAAPAPAVEPPAALETPSEPPREDPEDAAARRVESFDVERFLGKLAVPDPSEGDRESPQERERRREEELREKGDQLRRMLSRMGASGTVGGGGGVPYKFDNPTAGLSTPSGPLSFDTKGFDWGPYARRIYWIIWSNWHARMPPAVYTGQKGAVTVRFVIEKDGTLSTIQILDESGVPAYDSAAVLALEASNPLPPLPPSFPKEREGVNGRFLYNMRR